MSTSGDTHSDFNDTPADSTETQADFAETRAFAGRLACRRFAAPTTGACSPACAPASRTTSGSTRRSCASPSRSFTFLGGAGIPAYLACLLLIPEEGSDQSIAASLLDGIR